jgi:hypothetical protein
MPIHNRIYTTLLVVLAIMSVFSAGILLFLAGASTAGTIGTHLPDWSLPWVAVINAAYAGAIIATICSRQFNAEAARRLTRLLNWALLPAFPGGTVVGIYGLWNVDKETANDHTT